MRIPQTSLGGQAQPTTVGERSRHAGRARRRAGGFLALLTVLVGGAFAAQPAFGSTLTTPYSYFGTDSPSPEASGNWGTRTAATGDFNADGKNDVWVAAPAENVSTFTDAGRVRLISGASLAAGGTPTPIRTIEAPSSPTNERQTNAKFGFAISVLGDVSGDAKDDIAIGTDAQDVSGTTDQGKAWVFNGNTGALLYALNKPGASEASARFGSRIGRAGDIVDALGAAGTDGKSEIIVGASNADAGGKTNQGQAFIFNGASGTLVRTLDLPVADQMAAGCNPCGNFGLTVQGPGDIDGDGKPDQFVAAPGLTVGANASQGKIYVFSGANGALLRTINDPVPQANAFFGFQDAAPLSPGDVNADGKADIYGNGFRQNGPAPGSLTEAGRAWVFSGATGASLYEVLDPTATQGGQFGWALAQTDYDLNGTPDLYVGSSPHHLGGSTDERGGTYVFKGSDGSLFKTLELSLADGQAGATDLGSNLGWTVSAPGDLNADGNPDYVAGAPFHNVANTDQGRVYTFKSTGP